MKTATSPAPDSPRAARAEFTWTVRVYYEDTDSAGVVYHSNYLKFMERARTEWLRALGASQQDLQETEGAVFVVRSLNVEFLKPARIDDALAVHTQLVHVGGASLKFLQSIHNESGHELCHAAVDVACLDAGTFRPRRIPAFLRLELTHV